MLKVVSGHPAWTDDAAVSWWQPWAAAIAAAGFDGVRFDMNWRDPQVLAKCESIVGMLGLMRAFVSLGGDGPQWAAPDAEDYAEMAGQVARLLPAGAVLEVWNEPNDSHFWPAPASPTNYGHLAAHTYDVVKAVAPQVLVAAPNTVFNDQAYLQAFLEVAPLSFDWWAIHPYTTGLVAGPYEPDTAQGGWESFVGTLDSVRAIQLSHGADMAPLAITEIGWPVADPGPSHYAAAIKIARDRGVVSFGAFNVGDSPSERNGYSLFTPDMRPTLAAQVIVAA